MTQSSAVDPEIMAARYGRARPDAGRRRALLAAGVVAVVVLAAVLALQLSNLGAPSATADQHGFTVEDDTTVTVRFTLHADPGTTARCTLVAVNEHFTQVGFREVDLGPYAERSTGHEVEVTTTELATSGAVEDCVVAGP